MNVHERLRSDLKSVAVDPAAWPDFLVRFARYLGASEVALGGGHAGQTHQMIAPHSDPGFVGIYNDVYHQHNALMRTVLRHRSGTVTMTETLPEYEDFSRSELYNLWCVPQGFNHALALSLGSSTGWMGAMVVNTTRPTSPLQEDILRDFAPDLQRAVEQWTTLEQLRAANRLTLDTLDIAGLGAMFLDRLGHILECNASAQAMLNDGRLTIVEGQIRSLDQKSDAALGQMIARCLLSPDDGGGRLQIEGKYGPLQVQCAPFPGDLSYPAAQRPSMVVIVTDPQHKLRQRMVELTRLHGLTRAEVELALAVVQTGSRKAAAEIRGVSDTTARSQLTSIFDKTGVRRQTELVRLLMDEN